MKVNTYTENYILHVEWKGIFFIFLGKWTVEKNYSDFLRLSRP